MKVNEMDRTENNLISTEDFSLSFVNHVKHTVEAYKGYVPTHWGGLTFYNSSPAAYDLDHAVRTIRTYFNKVAYKINAHCIPVCVVGKTEVGKWHAHYCLLVECVYGTDKPKRRPKKRELEALWWKGQKRGRDRNWLYDPSKGGVVYNLMGHPEYLEYKYPCCPGKTKSSACKDGCVKMYKFEDVVRRAMRVNDEKITGRFSM